MKLIQRVIYIFLLLSLLACSKTDKTTSSDYLARLQSVLGVKVDKQESQALIFPQARSLKLDKQGSVLSIREFLSLRQCKLHTVIARRNSLIGKVALPSQLLFNDLEILQTVPACIEKLNQDKQYTLATKLSVYQTQKIEQIDTSLWQAILGQTENSSFWRVREQHQDYPRAFNNRVDISIKALRSFVEQVHRGNYHLNKQQRKHIEEHLQELMISDAGALYKKLMRLKNDLEAANKVIIQRLDKPLCLNGLPTEKARYFKNVVNQFFIGKVQVEAVYLRQRYQQLAEDYLLLEKRLWHATPKPYRQWKLQRDQDLQQALMATKVHVSYVQRLFEQCGLSVGL